MKTRAGRLYRRLAVGFLALAGAVLLLGANAHAYQSVSVLVDGQALPADVQPFLAYQRSYVPLRAICERLLDCRIDWNEVSNTATVQADGMTLQVTANRYGVNAGTYYGADSPNLLVNGRLYVPIRTLATALGGSVGWDGARNTALFYTSAAPAEMRADASAADACASYTDDDLLWLSRIIEAEAGGESMKGKIAVGNTILNRVNHPDYPDSIYGVIFDKNYGIQYTPTSNGAIWNTPSTDSTEAARRCLEGENVVGDSLFFLNPRIASSLWITKNRSFYCSIGNHDFYL